jgi:hypothetical protein
VLHVDAIKVAEVAINIAKVGVNFDDVFQPAPGRLEDCAHIGQGGCGLLRDTPIHDLTWHPCVSVPTGTDSWDNGALTGNENKITSPPALREESVGMISVDLITRAA